MNLNGILGSTNAVPRVTIDACVVLTELKNIMMLYRITRLFPVACVVFLLGACGTTSHLRDGAPSRIPSDVMNVPDAVPAAEPLSKYGNMDSYQVNGKTYQVLKSRKGYVKQGTASWYGTKFHGRRTSSGEPYDMFTMTAAHKTLPLPTYARVRNLDNGKEVVLKINDRGPFVDDRLIDLSYAAAARLGILQNGTGRVELTVIDLEDSSSDLKPLAKREENLFIQVGSFSEQVNAQKMQQRLQELAIVSGIQIAQNDFNKVFRVRVGPFGQRTDAERMVKSLAEMGIDEARVIKE